jgi:hypothetical protein
MDLKTLETKRDRAFYNAKALIDLVEKETRALTAEETKQHDGWLKELDDLGKQIARVKSDQAMTDKIHELTGGQAFDAFSGLTPRTKSLGQLVIESDLGRWLQESKGKRPHYWQSPVIELKLPEPERIETIVPTPTRPLVMADLPAQGTTTSNAIQYMQETAWTNAAAPVAEAGTKPESGMTFDLVSEAVRKIATWIPVSEEALDDVPQLRSYINARLALGVKLEVDDQLLNGTTTPPDLVGFLSRAGLAAPIARVDPATNMDVLLQQMTAIEIATGLKPDGLVINPANWSAIIGSKNTQGEYFVGSPFASPANLALWGVSVAVTPAITAGTALVGAFKSASQIFWRESMRLDVSNSHADFFIKNLLAIRAEVRLALAVYRPAAFGLVTGLT